MKTLPMALFVLAACGPETTAFRTTDQGDGQERTTAPAAAYLVKATERDQANVHVWSNGGYIGSSDEPMTHIGFEIRNLGTRPVVFDGDALWLTVVDKRGRSLPAKFTATTPLGPAHMSIAGGETTQLDAYFLLPVRPRVVGAMQARWSLKVGDDRYEYTTSFVRDDSYPVAEPPARLESTVPAPSS